MHSQSLGVLIAEATAHPYLRALGTLTSVKTPGHCVSWCLSAQAGCLVSVHSAIPRNLGKEPHLSGSGFHYSQNADREKNEPRGLRSLCEIITQRTLHGAWCKVSVGGPG